MPLTHPAQRALLLDSASLYFRAYFGVPEVIGPSGVPTNAVRGLLDMIASLIERGRPTHLVACWDNDWRPAFRVEAIEKELPPPSYTVETLAELKSRHPDHEFALIVGGIVVGARKG